MRGAGTARAVRDGRAARYGTDGRPHGPAGVRAACPSAGDAQPVTLSR
ncbi:hypothetical protein SBD_3234 [Streptomyces bottropensis ATCC 25435]|uniref:Uncharacterized protein n=1 Tax=Streptomyces bottropensis ATCC 25435 TaxID=1054862 RepID=M3DGT1_9ACTN|nr:hypothetical protein SBD_3234 [Streptomyces bottropensis ATCC 25435]